MCAMHNLVVPLPAGQTPAGRKRHPSALQRDTGFEAGEFPGKYAPPGQFSGCQQPEIDVPDMPHPTDHLSRPGRDSHTALAAQWLSLFCLPVATIVLYPLDISPALIATLGQGLGVGGAKSESGVGRAGNRE
jgi:hypothetical protein